MVGIYIVNINTAIDPSLINKMLPYLSLDRQNKVSKLRMFDDVHRSVIAELLIRSLIIDQLNIPNRNIRFGENTYHKPYLQSHANFEFNLSHSGEWVACAIDHHCVGIDIEQMLDINLEIAKRFFTPREYEDLIQRDTSVQQTHFYKLWTLKESYIKAVGKGLHIPLDSFSIDINDRNEITMEKEDDIPYFLHTRQVNSEYMLSVCSTTNHCSTLTVIHEEELINSFLLS
ncbi:4'-phosphopantetheinyl transferase family protein [Paenibacillus macquariensis]|uniref:4'-phosphopantetheinyl transferase n=1 Tax=Paenibacillus macquariensis TaxID=948756 RepID=A0ABY1K388_9BACL|nr:4'-phosphopantetheinyl transferase superfamily protein [Paenibacillus macquariensis]MEC0090301.1 4'-phosphopantetheinyl transferase superfamily protein [Paenibacillus macquariensis]OAB39659.1 hypothetical protein PMSM_00590 [Paenibacillus macquariensis subsp. macquariensis]SIR19102.1 4'-phosphopantetheinyl transferase [Paenibacillus macquariensis]